MVAQRYSVGKYLSALYLRARIVLAGTCGRVSIHAMDPTTIASRRKKLRLTQQQLASLAGVSMSTLSEIEGGKRTPLVTTYNALDAALSAREAVEPT